MNVVEATARLLGPVSDAFIFLTSTKVHSFYFPYLWGPSLHAARISIAYQVNARRNSVPLSWGTYLMGYLVMCWGGSILSHLFLGLPPPMFYSFGPWINYLGVHLFFTALFWLIPSALHPPTFDTFLFPLDALLRVNSVTSTLGLLSSPQVPGVYVSSPLTHMILGGLASAGGGLSAATLSTWSPDWTLSTPPVLRSGAGLWGTLDVWGGALVAVIYSVTTAQPAFSPFSYTLSSLASHPVVTFIPLLKPPSLADVSPLSPLGAKSVAAVVLGTLFGMRVVKVHWLGANNIGTAKSIGQAKKTSGKYKTQ